jgi:DNA-binding response OmpR family regulator
MNVSPIKILILEDDSLFAESLEDFLSEEGFDVTLADDGEKALDFAYEKHFDLLLLDVNVPKLSGFELLKTLRQNQQSTPAIFITSFKDKESIKKGFLTGGDDYMTKPVDVDELHLRILALLKRSGKLQESIMIGSVTYLPKEGLLTQDEKRYQPSKKVLLLLELLLENQNQLVSLHRINETLWAWDETPSASSLRVYINELKKILGKEHIVNHKAQGYKLAL